LGGPLLVQRPIGAAEQSVEVVSRARDDDSGGERRAGLCRSSVGGDSPATVDRRLLIVAAA